MTMLMLEPNHSHQPAPRRLDPLVPLRIETSQYIAKTVDQFKEFEEALALRAQIFEQEFGAELATAKIDIDEFDFKCDHLVIVDKVTHSVVGTYRLLASGYTSKFYSESEFEMRDFLATPGIKLELGRACVALEHRRGSVLNLLWRAVVQYAFQIKARYLFGCSSVKTTSFEETRALIQELRDRDLLTQEWNVRPLPKYQFPQDPSDGETPNPNPNSVPFPPLFRSYLKAGARVIGPPALDLSFKCIDFFTVLKLSDLAQSYENRYKTEFDN